MSSTTYQRINKLYDEGSAADASFGQWLENLDLHHQLTFMMEVGMKEQYEAIDEAKELFNARRAELFEQDENGNRVRRYTPREHARLNQEAHEELEETLADVRRRAEIVLEEAESVELPQPERPKWLKRHELKEANSRAMFVREDIEKMQAGELLDRLEDVQENGDRPEQWLHLRYAQDRWEELSQALEDSPAENVLEDEQAMAVAHNQHRFQTLIRDLGDAMLPEKERRRVADAEAQADEAKALIEATKNASPSYREQLAHNLGVEPWAMAEVLG